MSNGSVQEERLVSLLQREGYLDVLHGEADIKALLGLPAECNCADVLAFKASRLTGGDIVVAESKGTDVHHALIQLGNAAAGALARYTTAGIRLRLLVYVPRFRQLPVGMSPGPGYLVHSGPGSSHELLDARSETSFAARAHCVLGNPWESHNVELQRIPVEVYSEA